MKLVIQGGRRLGGVHALSGNKNAALPMIAASLLTSETVTLSNVPDITDVAAMLEAARTFGAKVVRDQRAGVVSITAGRSDKVALRISMLQKLILDGQDLRAVGAGGAEADFFP